VPVLDDSWIGRAADLSLSLRRSRGCRPSISWPSRPTGPGCPKKLPYRNPKSAAVPISSHTFGMNANVIDRIDFDEIEPDEAAGTPRRLRAFERAGMIEKDEAVASRLRLTALDRAHHVSRAMAAE
jgi:hypothetical protein